MLTDEQEKEISEFLIQRKKWTNFFEILKRKHVFIPMMIIIIGLIDNPDVYIIKSIVVYFKKYLNAW